MTRASRIAPVISLATILVLTVAAPAAGALTWTATRLDGSGFAFGPAAAVDSKDKVTIAWWSVSQTGPALSDGLSKAIGSGTSFAISQVSGGDYSFPSIAYDSKRVAHIAAQVNGGLDGLEYLRINPGGNVSEALLTGDPQATSPSIAVTSSDEVRIAYATFGSDPAVFVTVSDRTGWVTMRVWSGDAVWIRLAVGPDGSSHVVWSADDPETGQSTGIQYATDASGVWATTQLTTGTSDRNPDIAVDAAGFVHIVFARNADQAPAITELRGAGGSWTSTKVHPGLADGIDMVIDGSDVEHIAYHSLELHGGGTHYLTNASGHFVDSTVSPSGQDQLALSVTSTGTAYVAYLMPGFCCPFEGGLFVAHD